ncbi:MAG: histidinol-phosphate aminotransferase family protein [Chloroflexi bacterium]|nr:histidinol-phosphate aminotransferase family protein [Chloroflexota bacterium]
MSESPAPTPAPTPTPTIAVGAPPVPRQPAVPRVEHGGPDYAELATLGIRADALLDFSVNKNPLGASPRALRALDLVDVSVYPDDRCLRLRAALATAHAVRDDEVLVGNGSVELIWLLAEAYLAPGDTALILGPTFGEYEAGARRAGATVVQLDASERDGFRPDLPTVCAEIERLRPRVVFVCNPNNPTGQALDPEALRSMLASLSDGLLVVDEAYIELAEGVESADALRREDRRLVVLRSLTKSHGLAGLRLGYLLADPEVGRAISLSQPPWSVNAYAQAAGLAALGDDEYLREGRRLARRARALLVDGLEQLGFSCVPTRASFWLVRVGDGQQVRTELLRRGILVRDARSFGLPAYIRVSVRPLDECERLLAVLSGLVSSGVLPGDQVT